jgi:hypothetical protein
MDDDKIFGPLTLRQFLYLSLGLGLAYFAYKFWDSKLNIIVILFGLGMAVRAFLIPVVVIDENYIKAKRYNCKNFEEFQKWLRMKIAFCQSQIAQRKNEGMISDPKLEKALQMFETALRDIK